MKFFGSNVFQVERKIYLRSDLRKHFPRFTNYGSNKDVHANVYLYKCNYANCIYVEDYFY